MKTIKTLDEVLKLVRERELFVRYSNTPARDCRVGVSMNYATRQPEAGLSVNVLHPRASFACEEDFYFQTVAWLAEYRWLGRRCWLLDGERVGFGGDGEVVVRNAKPLAWVAPEVTEEAAEEAEYIRYRANPKIARGWGDYFDRLVERVEARRAKKAA